MAARKGEQHGLGTPVDSIKHKADSRTNIPSVQLAGFMEDEERAPKTLRYPRDPSLDPQLVWKEKDEQNAGDLEVPGVPIYIQEKIQPQALIEGLRADVKRQREGGYQPDMFADFNGISFEQMVEFYQHEQHWTNRMILGDSLLVMASLAEKENLKGAVQMIYIDPPYGIKFGSNWQVSTRKRDVKDGRADDMTRQPEQVKAFRDTWKMGINSYLSYMRDRLVLSRELLTDSGSVFVQIGDENVHLLRCLLNEVFGDVNFCALFTIVKTTGRSSELIPTVSDYILWYAKEKSQVKFRQPYKPKGQSIDTAASYGWVELEDGKRRALTAGEKQNFAALPEGAKLYTPGSLASQGTTSTGSVPFTFQGKKYVLGNDQHWKTSLDGMARLARTGRIHTAEKTIRYVRYINDFPAVPYTNVWEDTGTGNFTEDKLYVVQTATKIIERCLLMTTDPGDLVLDPTCGSGTTAYVAEQWGRRWITCDTSRVAVSLARTRLMAARYPYYLLTDSSEGQRKEAEITGKLTEGKPEGDVKKGFVYKRIPHITLKAIANNEEVDAIHARWVEQMDPIRADLNRLVEQTWEEWEIPRQAETGWPVDAKRLHAEWWELRKSRQQEIEESIARRAETEMLYDQPYEDNRRIRVTGPFTVESLSPHRVVPLDEAGEPATEEAGKEIDNAERFVSTILDNLRRAGVQNTKKGERIQFERLDEYPGGSLIQGYGEYTEEGGAVKRVAVCIGPQYGTVDQDLIQDAAVEAMQGMRADMLLVCGFAFDPYVAEGSRRIGRLAVVPVKMNPDLTMADELLKKTSAANLFMVFGAPDVEVSRTADGKVVVEVKGLDIFNFTTGETRSSSTDDIACWFIDTDYNDRAFFVRHAYFTGADQPYEKLKRALRAEVDEAAWASLYSTKSRPFDPPETGKIAVKVINHYGDEVLKVYSV